MPDLSFREPATPPLAARLGALLLCALWLLAGTVGHDPWKADDALNLGAAFGIAGGDWLVPRIAGEPWLVAPPLYHWIAAASGKLLGGLLPWHDAARLASALFGAALLALLWRLARRHPGGGGALAAPLLAIGTLGLLVPLHEAQPAIAAMAGFALALLGLLRWRDAPRSGGLLFGAGTGITFLAAGLDAAVLPVATALLLMPHPAWRPHGSGAAWLLALAAAAAIALPWPLLLHAHSPALFEAWWANEFASLAVRVAPGRDHAELLAWASWPVLPLAAWTLWLERRRPFAAHNYLPLAASLVALAAFLTDAPRPTALMPALVPLTLLAAAGAGRLRRGAAGAFDWFGMMTFSLVAALIWLGGIAMLTGEPARLAKNFTKPAPGFVAEAAPLALVLAVAASLVWITVMLRTPRSPWRAAARWSLGLATIWLLLVLLWLPWIDYGKTYRAVSADFRRTLGSTPGCIARHGLGLAQRASLDYFDGIRTVAGSHAAGCRWLIVQATPATPTLQPGWTLVKDASRPGDKSERLRLYRRE